MEREIIREIATAVNSLGQLATRILTLLAQNSENRNRRTNRENRQRREQNARRQNNNANRRQNMNRNNRRNLNHQNDNSVRNNRGNVNLNVEATREIVHATNSNIAENPTQNFTFSRPIFLEQRDESEMSDVEHL